MAHRTSVPFYCPRWAFVVIAFHYCYKDEIQVVCVFLCGVFSGYALWTSFRIGLVGIGQFLSDLSQVISGQ